jgi:hypothetical protein
MSAYVIVCSIMQLLPLLGLQGLPNRNRDDRPVLHSTPSMPQLYIKPVKSLSLGKSLDDSLSSVATEDDIVDEKIISS